MKKELEDKLFSDFKTLFPNGRNVNPKESLMLYGFCCDDGWYDLIYELCTKIMNITNKVRVVQVKEKYGGLRFYAEFHYEEEKRKGTSVYDLIHSYESKSFKVCEKCGKNARVRNDIGWRLTLCHEHYIEKLKTKK